MNICRISIAYFDVLFYQRVFVNNMSIRLFTFYEMIVGALQVLVWSSVVST